MTCGHAQGGGDVHGAHARSWSGCHGSLSARAVRQEKGQRRQRAASRGWLGERSMWRFGKIVAKVILVVWAGPNTLLGVGIGVLGLATGGHARWREGCLEFWGGAVTRLLRWLPIRPVAMALGHVVLGVDAHVLLRVTAHERVHTRQYERWGPFFLPAYFLSSLWVWIRGGDAYLDNPFEIEAYRSDVDSSSSN